MCGVLDEREFTLAELEAAVAACPGLGLGVQRYTRDGEARGESFIKSDLLEALTRRTEADMLRAAVRMRIKQPQRAEKALEADDPAALTGPDAAPLRLDLRASGLLDFA